MAENKNIQGGGLGFHIPSSVSEVTRKNIKNYLLIPDWSGEVSDDENSLTNKVINEFMQGTFLTDAVLFLLIDFNRVILLKYWSFVMQTLGGANKIKILIKNSAPIEHLMKGIDCLIAGVNYNEDYRFVEYAWRNGLKIVSAAVLLDKKSYPEFSQGLFDETLISSEVTQVKEQVMNSCNELFEKLPPNDWEYFLVETGMGDMMAFMFWLKIYKENRPRQDRRKVVALCLNDHQNNILQSCPYVELVVKISPLAFNCLSIYFSKKYRIKNCLSAYYSTNVLKKNVNHSKEYADVGGLIGVWRDFFNLNPKVKFKLYQMPVPQSATERALSVFEEMRLVKGKTVVIFTEGNTWGRYPAKEKFWLRLAEKIKNLQGYDVVTNSKQEVIPGCRNIFLTLQETVAFVGLCGNVVAIPTGFAEYSVAFNYESKILYQSVYPNRKNPLWDAGGMAWYLFRLPDLQYWGDQFIQRYMSDYELMMKNLSFQNVTAKAYQLGDTDEEDDALIDKIVEKIRSN